MCYMICFTLIISTILTKFIISHFKKPKNLPPGPRKLPILGSIECFRKSLLELEPLLPALHKKYGPILSLYIGSKATIFISDPKITHKALVTYGNAFSGRPPLSPINKLLHSDGHTISSSSGPLWRALRRNMVSGILSNDTVKMYMEGRRWVLDVLIHDLQSQALNDGVVVAMQSIKFAMFCILVFMCYGEKLEEEKVREIEMAHLYRTRLLYSRKFDVVSWLIPYLERRRMEESVRMLEKQKELLVPLFEARRVHKRGGREGGYMCSYVDSLLDVKLAEEGGRGLTDEEMVALCAEFMNAGTDTTWTTLQWAMAELVIHQDVQDRLYKEIQSIAQENRGHVEEEVLPKLPYLKAVVLELLRRHPPAHFVLPHKTTEDVEFEGYTIPKNSVINFTVAGLNLNETVWEEPMKFMPERFLEDEGSTLKTVDLKGTREIKMMPFGAGRRYCPGLELGILHLEYYLANLVKKFKWVAVEGEGVDLSEESMFTTVMKYPLRARLIPR